MQFHIRAELPLSELWDFKVNAEPRAAEAGTTTPAFRVAREVAGEAIKAQHGATAQLEWRGMVVFVNRAVPLERARLGDDVPRAGFARVNLESR